MLRNDDLGNSDRGSRATIRTDISGELAASLARMIKRGEELLAEGEAVCDAATHRMWQVALRTWRDTSSSALQDSFEPEAVAELLYATCEADPPLGTAAALRADLRAVKNGLALLTALRSSVRGPAGDRRRRDALARRSPVS
jgi:hypothetical protein